MALTTDFRQAGRICDVIGMAATLALCGWFGRDGSKVYVPVNTTDANHILPKLVGAEAFAAMVKEWPGEMLSVPMLDLRPLQRAGLVHRLTRHGISVGDITIAAGISRRQVHQIRQRLTLEGFGDIADVLLISDVTESEGGDHD